MSILLNGTNQALVGQDWGAFESLAAFSLRATVSHAQSAVYPSILAKINAGAGVDYAFIGYDRTVSPNRYRCHLVSHGGTRVCLYDWEQIEDANLHHLVFTYNSARSASRWMLWRDGTLLTVKTKHNDQAAMIPDNITPMVVGHAYLSGTLDNGTFGWGGRIAEVRFWNCALADDVAQHWSTGPIDASPYADLSGQLAYWPLGGCHGDHARDLFGTYSLTPYRNPTWTDHPPVTYPDDGVFLRRPAIEVRRDVTPIMLLGASSRAV